MRIFDKIFRSGSKAKVLTVEEVEKRSIELKVKHEKAKQAVKTALENYNEISCQCAYPRFQQLIGIDCAKTRDSFKCLDTDLLISISKEYFDISDSTLTDENTNAKWICKKCGSTYEYGWSDFSIYVERQKLELVDLKVELTGKATRKPIPLYLGLIGHSHPSKAEMTSVEFDDFEKYILEK
ncbi:MAG TPA: hypothetical protein PKH58_07300 [Paludibacteraceae bacterium]|jgi:hypothetical protein|nr:hypothetical protein [Paludibacteraceae bacterium]